MKPFRAWTEQCSALLEEETGYAIHPSCFEQDRWICLYEQEMSEADAARRFVMDFRTWMEEVDAALEARIGVGHQDLEDWCWRSSFNSGDSPQEAAEAFMEDIETEGW